jgi:hypothetical protein
MTELTDFEPFVEDACRRTERWFRDLPEWVEHIAHGDVSSYYGPTLLSEADCVMHFARYLNEAGVRWEDMHFELAKSQLLFAPPHVASTALNRWRADLALHKWEELLEAPLPARDDSFRFDAFLEFKIAGNHWQFGPSYGDPLKTRRSVIADVEKVASYLDHALCRLSYVVVFEECDFGFPVDFERDLEAAYPGCRVRILRAWKSSGTNVSSSA